MLWDLIPPGASITPLSEAGSSTLTSCPTIPEEETATSSLGIPTPPPPVASDHNRSRTMSRLQSGRSGNREVIKDTFFVDY